MALEGGIRMSATIHRRTHKNLYGPVSIHDRLEYEFVYHHRINDVQERITSCISEHTQQLLGLEDKTFKPTLDGVYKFLCGIFLVPRM